LRRRLFEIVCGQHEKPLVAARLSCRRAALDTRSRCLAIAVFLHFRNIGSMKATLTISGRGLIALPAKMREAAGIRPQDNLIAETTPEGILLRPAVTVPIEIYSEERIAEFDQAEAELAAWFEKNQPLTTP
jgi:bifunctional DNA-binding transcriptional regulator/antitoxin component of YhaV-PrlF toxin-antitoxin module